MNVLLGLGIVWAAIQLAVSPALLGVGRLAGCGTKGGWAARSLLLLALATGSVATGLVTSNWSVLVAILNHSPLRFLFAGFGVLAFTSLALGLAKVVRSLIESRLPEVDVDPPELRQALEEAADNLGIVRLPRLIVHQAETTPAVAGIMRPILLAPSYLCRLDADVLRLIVSHELAHLKLRHLPWAALMLVVDALLWPNPISRFAHKSTYELAEKEVDVVLGDLDFDRDQVIRAQLMVRQAILSGRPAPAMSFASDIPGSTKERSFGRELIAAILLATASVALAAAPVYPLSNPGAIGSVVDKAFVGNSLAGHFNDSIGDWTRSRYDIVFERAGAIARMRGDGSHYRIINREPGGQADVSNDGSIIVTVGKNYSHQADLFLMDGEGKRRYALTDTEEDEWQPSLSPDGKQVVYFALIEGHGEVRLMDIPTGKITNLSHLIGEAAEPSFSSDGKSILYEAGHAIWRLDLQLMAKQKLTPGPVPTDLPRFQDHGPRSSPDGQHVIFTRQTFLPTDQWNWSRESGTVNRGYTIGIWIMDADGNNPRPLTSPSQGFREQCVGRFAPTGIWVGHSAGEVDNDVTVKRLREVDTFTGEEREIFPDEFSGWPSYTGFIR